MIRAFLQFLEICSVLAKKYACKGSELPTVKFTLAIAKPFVGILIREQLSVYFLRSLLSHIFSATAASEGLGNPVARAS